MQPTSYQSSSERRRMVGLALAVIAHLLVLIVMLRLAPSIEPLPKQKDPTTFTLNPVPNPAPTPGAKKPVVAKVAKSGAGSPPKSPKPPAAPVTPPPPMPEMIGGKEMFDAVGLATARPSRQGDGESSGELAGKDSGSTYGPGAGPGGERLYNAEWYREPSSAELNGYLPPRAQPGWGLIACRTIADYHVENCKALGESPLGSGLARAFREAAWQFRVRPPRIGGKPQVGTWVQIRITLMDSGQVTAR